jgi:DNA-binding NarL/FixJ family response regulator
MIPMKSLLTIVVACGSLHIGDRIVQRLSQFRRIEIVALTRELDDTVDVITERNPRLVIVDISLSGGSGLEVLRIVKERQVPPVVMMTSSSSCLQYRRQCIKEGAARFFRLPDEFDDFVAAIRLIA